MKFSVASPVPMLRVAVARALHGLRWSGWLGLALLVIAMSMAGRVVWKPQGPRIKESSADVVTHTASIAELDVTARPALPRRDEVPSLLARIEQAVTSHGLIWPSADYRIHPFTDHRPASLEVRFKLKGPYPKQKELLGQLMKDMPFITLREIHMNRSDSALPDIDARWALMVFLNSDVSPAEPSAAGVEMPGTYTQRNAFAAWFTASLPAARTNLQRVAPPSTQPPPEPVAVQPVIPLQAIGTWDDGKAPGVFVATPSGTQIVRTGDVLLESYRVTGINTHTLVLEHIQTKRETTLPIPQVPPPS